MTHKNGWTLVDIDRLLTREQLLRLKDTKTAKDIKDIVHSDTSKMAGVVIAEFLVYALMHEMRIYS